MTALLDAFWRAAAYCLHPRVILLSLVPLVLAGGLAFALGCFFWEPAVAGVRATLESWALVDALLKWLERLGGGGLRALLAPLVDRGAGAAGDRGALAADGGAVHDAGAGARWSRAALWRSRGQARRGGCGSRCSGRSAARWSRCWRWCSSLPLWFVPPLVLVVPPLIWGWLTCRVMAFDVLAEHASADERRAVLREQRWPLLAIGVICGYLGAAPTLLWALGAAALVFAPVLVLVSVWLYTLVFAFAALWFAHFALAALQRLRAQQAAVDAAA